MKKWNSLKPSAPTVVKYSSGEMTLPLDFDIPDLRGGSSPGRTAGRKVRVPPSVRPGVAQRPCEKARVEEMQDSVGYTADVLVDRHVVTGSRDVDRARLGLRVAKP